MDVRARRQIEARRRPGYWPGNAYYPAWRSHPDFDGYSEQRRAETEADPIRPLKPYKPAPRRESYAKGSPLQDLVLEVMEPGQWYTARQLSEACGQRVDVSWALGALFVQRKLIRREIRKGSNRFEYGRGGMVVASFADTGRIDVRDCGLCGSAHRDHLAWVRGGRIEYRCPNRNRITTFDGDGDGSVPARVPPRPSPAPASVALEVPLEEPVRIEAVAS